MDSLAAATEALNAVNEINVTDGDAIFLRTLGRGNVGDTLMQFMDGHSDLSINSNGSIVDNRENEGEQNEEEEEEEEEELIGEEMTKMKPSDPRDRTGTYQGNVKYRRTTIANKWGTANNPGTMQNNAKLFSKQTGLHVHIIFDPVTKKKNEFKSSNMREEPEQQTHQQVLAITRSSIVPFGHHSPGKQLNLPPSPFTLHGDLGTLNVSDIAPSPLAKTFTFVAKKTKKKATSTVAARKKKTDKIDFKKLVREETMSPPPSLPGGAAAVVTSTRPKRKASRKAEVSENDKCAVCSVSYDSTRDRQLLQDRRFGWIGCDFSGGCGYWAHAFCARFEIPGSKNKKLPEFLCPSHEK